MDFSSMLQQARMGDIGPGAGAGGDQPQHDNAEMIYISSLALLKVCCFSHCDASIAC
jgi:26S proteasome regulatory subunit N11